ncbi:MAG: HK97 gp10 family phage protein [Oscillospiraceae bacterium]|nr:HK97 gp10 family phage protein [Oscillospiraceae bacterium]
MGAQIQFPHGFLAQLNSLETGFDDTAEEALGAAGEVVREVMAGRLQNSLVGDDRATDNLVESLGVSPMKVDRNGNFDVKVGFFENRLDGISNAKLANIIEHGRSDQNRPPRPFLRPTRTRSRKRAIAAMQNVLARWVATMNN